MCGSLRHSQFVSKKPMTPGSFIPSSLLLVQDNPMSLKGRRASGEIIWDSFARSETYKEKFKVWKRGELLVEGYTERGRPYEVPKGHAVQVLTLERRGKTYLRILTRRSVGQERLVHGRWPLTAPRRLTEED